MQRKNGTDDVAHNRVWEGAPEGLIVGRRGSNSREEGEEEGAGMRRSKAKRRR